MGVNISNKEYNFFIVSETCRGAVFLYIVFLKYTPFILNSLTFLTLKNFIVTYWSDRGRVNKIFVFAKPKTLNLTLSQPSSKVEFFCIFRTAYSFPNILISKIWSIYTGSIFPEIYWARRYYIYDKLYLQKATKGQL